jgi:hypothetical protein
MTNHAFSHLFLNEYPAACCGVRCLTCCKQATRPPTQLNNYIRVCCMLYLMAPTPDEELLHQREKVNRVRDLVTPLLKHVRRDALGDDMSAMAFCFVNKQMEHIKSIYILIDNHQYRDAWAISRIMFEGGALLFWASQDSTHTRAYNWKSYLWVGEFRQWYGKPEYLLKKTEIEFNLKTHCTQFLKGDAKEKTQGQITPKNYGNKWHTENLKDIIDELKFAQLYGPVYSLTSGWLHWDSYLINMALEYEGDNADYTNETKWVGILAYIIGYRSLLLSAKVFDDLFDLRSPDLQAEFDLCLETLS